MVRALARPSDRMLTATEGSGDDIVRLIDMATMGFVHPHTAVIFKHGTPQSIADDIEKIGPEEPGGWTEMGNGWWLSAWSRRAVVVAVPELAQYVHRIRGTVVAMFDTLGSDVKCAACSLEDIGMCNCRQGTGEENTRAKNWLARALRDRWRGDAWTTVENQLTADGPIDGHVVHARVQEMLDTEKLTAKDSERMVRQTSGFFEIPPDIGVYLSTVPRADELLRLARHPSCCPSLQALTRLRDAGPLVLADYYGVEAWLSHVDGDWQIWDRA